MEDFKKKTVWEFIKDSKEIIVPGIIIFIIVSIIFNIGFALQLTFIVGIQTLCALALFDDNKKYSQYYCIISMIVIYMFIIVYWAK